MATLARVELLGVFEDGPQRDFVGSLVEIIAPAHGCQVVIEPRLTAGCRFDYLNEHLDFAPSFAGVVIGVDGARHRRDAKIEILRERCPMPPRMLWAVAEPSVEEWMMADAEALPAALRELFGAENVRYAPRPGRASAERTAKQRLRDWVQDLLGEPALQGGVEYASDVARKVNPSRVGESRNGDLRAFFEELPQFLTACAGHCGLTARYEPASS